MDAGLEITLVTMDVQGAFDALLKRGRMTKQAFPLELLKLVDAFLSGKEVRVPRLEKSITPSHDVSYGTLQGLPLSPVLYMLYLAKIPSQGPDLRFGYADNVYLHRVSVYLISMLDSWPGIPKSY